MSIMGRWSRSPGTAVKGKINRNVTPTGVERQFSRDDIIVSKTDLKGRITYVNKTFLEVSSFTEAEMIGAPHSIIRHPSMPRCVFKLLWDTVQDKREIFAYVVNLARNGDHYWVFAHVTPSLSGGGEIIGYHSNRRVPERAILDAAIIPLYEALLAQEAAHSDRKRGLEASTAMITKILEDKGLGYDEFVFSL